MPYFLTLLPRQAHSVRGAGLAWSFVTFGDLTREKLMAAKFVLKVSAIALIVFSCRPSPAATLSPGDIVVALDGIPSARNGAIYKVDPVTGDRTILTGMGVGSGPDILAFGVAVGSVNDVYFTEANLGTSYVYHLDVATGERKIIASPIVGSGPEIYGPSDILVRSDGKLIVASVGDEALFLLDPVTLERTILSGYGVGSGPEFTDPNGLAFDANGDIIATAGLTTVPSGVFRIDSFTGDREVISPFPAQIDPHYADGLVDVAVDSQGRYFVSNLGAFHYTACRIRDRPHHRRANRSLGWRSRLWTQSGNVVGDWRRCRG